MKRDVATNQQSKEATPEFVGGRVSTKRYKQMLALAKTSAERSAIKRLLNSERADA